MDQHRPHTASHGKTQHTRRGLKRTLRGDLTVGMDEHGLSWCEVGLLAGTRNHRHRALPSPTLEGAIRQDTRADLTAANDGDRGGSTYLEPGRRVHEGDDARPNGAGVEAQREIARGLVALQALDDDVGVGGDGEGRALEE